jgi:hypothetical protein
MAACTGRVFCLSVHVLLRYSVFLESCRGDVASGRAIGMSVERRRVMATRAPFLTTPYSGSCSSSLRVNTRGLPGGHYKAKKFYQRGPSGSPSGPLTPGDGLDASHADARRHSGPLPLLCPTTPVDSHPHRLRPGWHTKQQHFAQRPDVIGEPRGHGRRPRPPLRGGARAVGRDRLCQRHA